MILNIDDQVLINSTNLSATAYQPETGTNYSNISLVNKIAYTLLSESFEFTNYIANYLTNIALNLQNDGIESSFEFKILTVLLICLLVVLVAISICWKVFGQSIDHFYKNQELYTNKKSSKDIKNTVGLLHSKVKTQ